MGQGLENYRTAKHLERLYVLMHCYIRTADDIERAGKGVYSPGLRDDAQDGRNALFTMLSDIPGKATYLALRNLMHSHPNVDARSRSESLIAIRCGPLRATVNFLIYRSTV